MFTIVKAFENVVFADNRFITRTLGKIGFFQRDAAISKGFWLVEITKELKGGLNSGAFILKPITKIKEDQVTILSLKDCRLVNDSGGKLHFVSKHLGYTMLSLKCKKAILRGHYAVILEFKASMLAIDVSPLK